MSQMPPKEELKKMCLNDDGSTKPKSECRAEMINRLILDPELDYDIDEVENMVDQTLREFNLWNEPSLEELLKEDESESEEK